MDLLFTQGRESPSRAGVIRSVVFPRIAQVMMLTHVLLDQLLGIVGRRGTPFTCTPLTYRC